MDMMNGILAWVGWRETSLRLARKLCVEGYSVILNVSVSDF